MHSIPPPNGTAGMTGDELLEAPRPGPDVMDKLQDLLESVGGATDLTTTLWRLVDATQKWSMIFQGKQLLEVDQVGRRFGGGEYRMRVTWRTQGVTRGKPYVREIEFIIGPEYDELVRGRGGRPAGANDPVPLDTEKVLQLAEKIASIRQPQASSGDGPALVAMVERLMDRMDRMQERSDAKFEQLVQTLQRQPAAQNPTEALREVMAFGKEMGIPMLSGFGDDKREPWLEIAEMVGSNVGKFLEMLTAAQASNAAKVRILATNPQARKLATVGKRELENPESRAKMIAHLDGKIGAEQTDKILEGLRVKRG